MELSASTMSCHQCGTSLISDIGIPPSPTPYLLHTLGAPDESEVVNIKSYMSNVDHLITKIDADLPTYLSAFLVWQAAEEARADTKDCEFAISYSKITRRDPGGDFQDVLSFLPLCAWTPCAARQIGTHLPHTYM